MFKINTTEEKWINGNHSVQVTFLLPNSCWCRLLKKKFWKKLQEFLLVEENKYNQMLRIDQKEL